MARSKPNISWAAARRATRFITIAVLTPALLLPGCATDGQRTRTEGAAAGAVIGAGLGQALGRNRDSTLLGAVLGAVIGAAVGDNVAQRKAQYVKEEDSLKQSADQARQVAQASREQNERMTQDIAALDTAVQQLKVSRADEEARRVEGVAQQRQLTAMQATIDARLKVLQGEIAAQTALLQQTQAARIAAQSGKAQPQPSPSEGIQVVSAGVRDLEQQARELEYARLQLQQIDRRRAY